MNMDLVTYPEARAAFRGAVLTANYEGWAELAKATNLEDVRVTPFVMPAWGSASNFRCVVRLLDLNRPIGERIAVGLRFPDLDAVTPATKFEFHQGQQRFMLTAGAVASALAIYGVQDTRNLADGTGWKRVDPFAPWPEQAQDALQEAVTAANAFVPVWLGYMGTLPGNTFLPGVAR